MLYKKVVKVFRYIYAERDEYDKIKTVLELINFIL